MTKQPLAKLLEAARGASRQTRIDYRDPIAEHGADAVEAVSPWVEDPELAAFAVRVIEAAARFGARDAALRRLSSIARTGGSTTARSDAEAALQRLQPRSSPPREPTGVRLSSKAGWSWPGFQPADFEGVKDTSWRRRDDPVAMIPLVLRPLLEIDGDFATWPIYRLPEVHLAVRDRYQQGGDLKQGFRASKLFVYADQPVPGRPDDVPHVAAGWYLEKGDGKDEFGPVTPELWDWPRFLELLADPDRRTALETAMRRHDLLLGEYLGGSFHVNGAVVGFRGRFVDERLVLTDLEGATIGEGWDALLDRLRSLPVDDWHCFHIWREWPATEAIEMGQPFAGREVAPVLVDLARVYLDTVWPGRATTGPGTSHR